MSGIERIKEKILQDANDEAKERLERATAKAGEMIESARKEAAKVRDSILEKAEREAADNIKLATVLAGIEYRKEILDVKKQLLQKAFNRTMEMLCNMPDEDCCRIFSEVIIKLALEENCNDFEIVLSNRDRERIGSRLMQLIRENGSQINVRLSDMGEDICGGFILKAGDVEWNYSFETIMRVEGERLETLFWSME